jgi:hypothetical protein
MHESREGRQRLLDMMEPERPKVNCSILEFVKSASFMLRISQFELMAFDGEEPRCFNGLGINTSVCLTCFCRTKPSVSIAP